MIAILVKKGLNIIAITNRNADHIWLQSFPIGAKYDCIVGNSPRVTWLLFLNESRQNKFAIIAIIFSPNLERLQSYMVSFRFVIAIIFGPYLKGMQPYLVLMITLIANIYGPFHKNYCNHKWSSPIWLGYPSIWTKYACNFENSPCVTWLRFLNVSRENKLGCHCFHHLQAYLVPYIKIIAIICGRSP